MSGKIEISRELAERLLNFTCNEEYDELRALLAAPVVERQPVAVALPERRDPTPENPHLTDADHEWNACLDKAKELNQ